MQKKFARFLAQQRKWKKMLDVAARMAATANPVSARAGGFHLVQRGQSCGSA
jgi:hypothetical protein